MTEQTVPEPWLQSVEAVLADAGTDRKQGLTGDEAGDRLARHGPNELDAARPVPAWRRLLSQLASPLIYLLLFAVVVSVVAWVIEGGEELPFDAIVILAIIALNAVLGYVQESRAEQAVAALQRMAAASAGVVRDGREQRVPSLEVVPGDVLLLAEGDAVAADARVIESASLMVAEASLTGESEPVSKSADVLDGPVGLGDRYNMVFSGTAVTRGRGRAVVTGTGMTTEMGRIATLLESTEETRTPLQLEVDWIGRALGIAVVVITAVVVGAMLLTADEINSDNLITVLLVGVSLAVAAVPEGLPAILSVVLALGVQRMARRKAIVKKLSSVETLGSASAVCTDKTGTLTRNEMTIVRLVTPSGEAEVTGSGYRPDGELIPIAVDEGAAFIDEVGLLLGGGSLANDARLLEQDGQWAIQGDPTEASFLVAEAKLGTAGSRKARFRRVGEIPFSSERKLMSTFEEDRDREGRIDLVTKGAPDVLLTRCSRERIGSEIRDLTDSRREQIMRSVDGLADQALRTIAVAYRPLEDSEPPAEDESVETDLVYLGTVGIIDPPRPEVKAAILEATEARVRVLMVTGDHPRTAARIASELGITDGDSPVVTGAELEALDDAALEEQVRHASIYARVAPEHKLRIVRALQANKGIVAMTGDGVNDAPALKKADIGVAMGVTGTEVSKEAADMILADDNFATIIAAVREGRGIFSNIRKFLRFLLSSNIGEVLTMFFGVVLAGVIGLEETAGIAVPLLATQILWINLLTDTGPALAMGVEPPPDDVMQRPPRLLTDRVIDGAMWVGIFWVGGVMAVVTLAALDLSLPGGLLEGTGEMVFARTMAFTTLVLAQLFNCFNARSEETSAFRRLFSNALLWAAIGLSVLLQVAVVHLPLMNEAFGTTPLALGDWLICLGLGSIVLWSAELRKLVLRLRHR